MGRILSVDYGLARIGLALSDPLKMIASPLPTLQCGESLNKTCKELLKAVPEKEIETIVVGLPLNMDGSRGKQVEEVEVFIHTLQKVTDIPVKTWDERLTTVQADRMLKQDNLSRKKRSQSVDAVAALLILQSYLDSL